MLDEHGFEESCPDLSLIYPPQQPFHIPTAWRRQHIVNLSPADLSQNETVPSSHTNSAQFCFPDSLGSDNTFAALAAEAQQLWGSTSRNREPLSDISSFCSSASTVTSSISCAYPTLSAAASFGLAPSFDFTRQGEQLSPFANKPTHSVGINLAASIDPSHLCSLSVGSGYAWNAASRWQEHSAMETQELEEYSLGSGRPSGP